MTEQQLIDHEAKYGEPPEEIAEARAERFEEYSEVEKELLRSLNTVRMRELGRSYRYDEWDAALWTYRKAIADADPSKDFLRSEVEQLTADNRELGRELDRLRLAIDYASQMGTDREHIQKYLRDTIMATAVRPGDEKSGDAPTNCRAVI